MDWQSHVTAEFTRRQKSADASVVEELAQHAAAAFEAARADGQSASDAEVTVRGLIAAWCEGTSGPRTIERAPLIDAAMASRSPLAGLGLDVRHALRLIRRQPGAALISILMIGLGIGATTSLFSLVNGVLLKPLPWKDSDRLVRVYETRQAPAIIAARYAFTNATYHAWVNQPQTIDGVGGWLETTMLLPSDAGLERVPAANVTATVFPLLSATPLLGRVFTADDEIPDNTIVLSYGYWRSRFGGSRDVIGRTIVSGGRSRTIIGVMPQDLEFPTPETRVWIPYYLEPAYRGGISVYIFNAFARLKPGVTPAQAADEASARLDAIQPPVLREVMADDAGGSGPLRVTVIPMLDFTVKSIEPGLWILLSAGTLLFLAAVGTVVNIQLAQATSRRKEIAIRSAIGAGTGRVARQLFVEIAALSTIGAALGLLMTVAILRALPHFLPEDFPRATHITIDARVLGLVAALAVIVSLIIGLLPTNIARRFRLTSVLAEDGLAPVGQGLRSSASRSRAIIIAAQVAIAAVLLVSASVLSQSFVKMLTLDRGYDPSNLLTARIGFQNAGLPAGARAAFFTTLVERVAAMPGVRHAGFTNSLPLTAADPQAFFNLDRGHIRGLPDEVQAAQRTISPGYVASVGIRLLKGREFTSQDTYNSELVMLVNEEFVRRYLQGDPIDRRLHAGLDETRHEANPWRIVGVVGDVRHRDASEPPEPEVYAPAAQMKNGPNGPQFLTVRSSRDASSVAADLRALVRQLSPNAVIDQVMPMEARLTSSLARPRLYAVLVGGFATFALLIAAIGLFGGLSYGVTQRTREIGVRTALGATPRHIVTMVMQQGAVVTVLGLVTGLAAAAASVRHLSAFLFGVEPLDPLTFAAVGTALILCAVVACAIPARRAARIDAIEALRH